MRRRRASDAPPRRGRRTQVPRPNIEQLSEDDSSDTDNGGGVATRREIATKASWEQVGRIVSSKRLGKRPSSRALEELDVNLPPRATSSTPKVVSFSDDESGGVIHSPMKRATRPSAPAIKRSQLKLPPSAAAAPPPFRRSRSISGTVIPAGVNGYTLSEKLRESQMEGERLMRRIEKLQGDKKRSERRRTEILGEKTALEAKLSESQAKCAALFKRLELVERLQSELKDLEKVKAGMARDYDAMKAQLTMQLSTARTSAEQRQAEIGSLNVRLKQVQGDADERARLAQLDAGKIAKLTDISQTQETTITALRAEVVSLQAMVTGLQEEVRGSDLKQSASDAAVASLESKLAEATQHLASAEARCQRNEGRRPQQVAERAFSSQLEGEIAALKAKVLQQTKTIKDLEAHEAVCDERLKTLEREHQEREGANTRRIKELEVLLKGALVEKPILERKSDKTCTKCVDHLAEVKSLKKSLALVRAEITSERHAAELLQKKTRVDAERIETLTQANALLKDQTHRLSKDQKVFIETVAKLNNEISLLQGRIRHYECLREADTEKQRSETHATRAKTLKAESDRKALHLEVECLKKQLASQFAVEEKLMTELKGVRIELEGQMMKLQSCTKRLKIFDATEASLKQFERDLESTQKELSESRSAVLHLSSKMNSLSKEVKVKDADIQESDKRLRDLQNAFFVLQEKGTKDAAAFKDQIAILERQVQLSESALGDKAAADRRVAALEAKLQAAEAATQCVAKKLSRSEARSGELQSGLLKAQEQCASAQALLLKSTQERDLLQAEVDEQRRRCEELLAKCADLEATLRANRACLDEASVKAKTLAADLLDCQTELSVLRKSSKVHATRHSGEVEKLKARHSGELEELKAKLSGEMQKLREKHKQKLQGLKGEAQRARSAHDAARAKISSHEEEIRALQEKWSEASSRLEKFNRKLKSQREDAKRAATNQVQENEVAAKRLNAMSRENDKLCEAITAGLDEVVDAVEKESKAVSKQANLKLLLKEAQATEGEREKDYAKEEIKSLKSRIQILIYNLSASEKQLSEFDADNVRKQKSTREHRISALEKKLSSERRKCEDYIKSSKVNSKRLDVLLSESRENCKENRKMRETAVRKVVALCCSTK